MKFYLNRTDRISILTSLGFRNLVRISQRISQTLNRLCSMAAIIKTHKLTSSARRFVLAIATAGLFAFGAIHTTHASAEVWTFWQLGYVTSIAGDTHRHPYSLIVTDGWSISRVSPGGQMTALAGGLLQGFQDGIGRHARLHEPSGFAIASDGMIFFAEGVNNCIRSLDPKTREVRTVAGHPDRQGHRDGPSAQAMFNSPTYVAVDREDNILISDTGNHMIRKIDRKTGNVSTLAGGGVGFADGVGNGAQFNEPFGLTVGLDGEIYIADNGNHAIRRLIPATKMVTTFAGRPGVHGLVDGDVTSAQFKLPTGVAIDSNGNLIVGEWGGGVRKIDLRTNAVTAIYRYEFAFVRDVVPWPSGGVFTKEDFRPQMSAFFIAPGDQLEQKILDALRNPNTLQAASTRKLGNSPQLELARALTSVKYRPSDPNFLARLPDELRKELVTFAEGGGGLDALRVQMAFQSRTWGVWLKRSISTIASRLYESLFESAMKW